MKKELPIVAIMYDFDKTLCTKDMQEYTFIPSLNESAEDFWNAVDEVAKREKMDPILTYMYMMLRMSRDRHKPILKDVFKNSGKNIKLFPGVEEWFDRINQFGKENGVQVEHYIISSGLREIIEGSPIADRFKEIYACEYHYDENGMADWPKLAVNYTNKTQFLFRINKGLLDSINSSNVNLYIPTEKRRVPFRNMIYIGDGITDVPCMKLVNINGGQSIAVYSAGDDTVARQMLSEDRVNFIAKANYKEGKELDLLVKDIIVKISSVDKLVAKNYRQRKDLDIGL